MKKGRDGGETENKRGKKEEANTDENSGHYVIAISRPPERRPLERRTLAPIMMFKVATNVIASQPPERRPTGMPLRTLVPMRFYT